MNLRSGKSKLGQVTLAALLLIAAGPAQANHDKSLDCLAATALWTVPATIVDLGFGGSAIYQLATGKPDHGVALAETIVMMPQLVASSVFLGLALRSGAKNPCIIAGMSLTMLLSGVLFAHGVWTLGQPEVTPLPGADTVLLPQLHVGAYRPAASFGVTVSRRF